LFVVGGVVADELVEGVLAGVELVPVGAAAVEAGDGEPAGVSFFSPVAGFSPSDGGFSLFE
jgi:hypothetical protein